MMLKTDRHLKTPFPSLVFFPLSISDFETFLPREDKQMRAFLRCLYKFSWQLLFLCKSQAVGMTESKQWQVSLIFNRFKGNARLSFFTLKCRPTFVSWQVTAMWWRRRKDTKLRIFIKREERFFCCHFWKPEKDLTWCRDALVFQSRKIYKLEEIFFDLHQTAWGPIRRIGELAKSQNSRPFGTKSVLHVSLEEGVFDYRRKFTLFVPRNFLLHPSLTNNDNDDWRLTSCLWKK